MRLDLIAMKDEILKEDLNQARANFARVLELQAVSEAQCSGKARPQESALPNTKEGSEILNLQTELFHPLWTCQHSTEK